MKRIGIDVGGTNTDAVLIEDVVARPMTAAPRPVVDALERADAGILCVQPVQGELRARMAIVAVVERRAIRYAHMVGVTPQIMRQGMRADYRLVRRACRGGSARTCGSGSRRCAGARRARPAAAATATTAGRDGVTRPAVSSAVRVGAVLQADRCADQQCAE